MSSTQAKPPSVKCERRLSLPVNPFPADYRERLRPTPADFSTISESGSKLDMDKSDSSDKDESDSPNPPPAYRRRTYSDAMNYCIPEIVIEEAPPPGDAADSSQRAAASLRQRLTYKMDHLRTGDLVTEQANEKDRQNEIVLMKRQELANEQIAKSSQPADMSSSGRRKSVPNLKSVLEEEPGDE